MSSLLSDLRHAAKLLVKERAFSLTAVLTLALCIGANSAVFSIVSSVLLGPLPFPNSDRIVLMYNSYPHAGVARAATGVPDYYDRLRDVGAFEEQALYQSRGYTIGEPGSTRRVRGMAVTPSFFRLLRARPALGRIFTEEEGEIGNEHRILLSHGLWQELGGGASLVGAELRANGTPHTVVGTMPEEFLFLSAEIELWTPLAFTKEQRSDDARHNNSWDMLGRLAPGATLERAQQQIDALNARNMERFPQFREILASTGFHTVAVPLQEELVRDVRETLYLLWGGVVFVLLIGGVNATNLVLVRAHLRSKELATRHALGAGRSRLARHLLTETMLIALLGGSLGLIGAHGVLRVLDGLGIERIPRGAEIGIDASSILYTLGVSVLIGLLMGALAVAVTLRTDLGSVLHEETRSSSGSRRTRLARRILVAAQISLALVLLVGAGLLLASFREVLSVDPGFRPDGVVTASVSLAGSRYEEDAPVRSFVARALERIRSLPEVVAAGATDTIPFGGGYSDSVILPEGHQPVPGESLISPSRSVATPGYFEAMGIDLVRGRLFTENDHERAPRVILIDEELARKFWPDEDPIGRRTYSPNSPEDLLRPTETASWHTVVGVVETIRQRGLVDVQERIGAYYYPFAQDPSRSVDLAIRNEGSPEAVVAAVRSAIAEIDPEIPLFDIRTMSERLDLSLLTRKAPLWLSAAFGVLALFLSVVGLYGVLAYLVAQRRREFGVRLALGSTSRGIFRLVLSEGLQMVGLGLLFGFLGVLAVRRILESQLYGIRALDPSVLAAAGMLLALIALAASLLPARRATRIDPVGALRQE